jgi:hypothetical protein
MRQLKIQGNDLSRKDIIELIDVLNGLGYSISLIGVEISAEQKGKANY